MTSGCRSGAVQVRSMGLENVGLEDSNILWSTGLRGVGLVGVTRG